MHLDVARHDLGRILLVFLRLAQSIGVALPPQHRARMRARIRQRQQVGGELVDNGLVDAHRDRCKAQHRMRSGDRTVGFDVGTDVDLFGHGASHHLAAQVPRMQIADWLL